MSSDLVKRLRQPRDLFASRTISLWKAERAEAAARIEELEAKLAKAVDVIDWVLICWDDHNEHGYRMQGDWVHDARATLAELTGGKNDG